MSRIQRLPHHRILLSSVYDRPSSTSSNLVPPKAVHFDGYTTLSPKLPEVGQSQFRAAFQEVQSRISVGVRIGLGPSGPSCVYETSPYTVREVRWVPTAQRSVGSTVENLGPSAPSYLHPLETAFSPEKLVITDVSMHIHRVNRVNKGAFRTADQHITITRNRRRSMWTLEPRPSHRGTIPRAPLPQTCGHLQPHHSNRSRQLEKPMQIAMKSDEEISKILEDYARSMGKLPRSPILHDPSEVDLQYEDVFFPSYDGVPLEGWFIPRPGSNKLIVANHPMGFSRAGFPSHLEPWKSVFGATGNTIEVNFVPDYRVLHDAGYNVLAYDLRNFGHSGPANAQSVSAGRYESRDVIGSLIYARSRPDTKDMVIALFSRCLGFTSTLWAMHLYPAVFKAQNISCLVGPQPISPQILMERNFERDGIPMDRMAELDRLVRIQTSFSLFDLGPQIPSKSVMVPTFVYQVKDDLMTKPMDVQTVYDNMPIKEKKLFWIEGTTRRWDGYTYFQRLPDLMLAWFEKYMV